MLRATNDVMMSLIDNIETFIQWPRKEHYPQIAQHFQEAAKGRSCSCTI